MHEMKSISRDVRETGVVIYVRRFKFYNYRHGDTH